MPQCERATRSVPLAGRQAFKGRQAPSRLGDPPRDLYTRGGFRLGEENSHLV